MTEVKSGPAAAMGAGKVRRWLPWVGGLLGLLALAWVLRHFDLDRFRSILAGADPRWLVLVPLSILVEQLVRAWKWRQLLYPLRPIGVLRRFGTIARSWLVARRVDLKLASVLATFALDRLTDGIVFACLVPLAMFAVVFDDPTGGIRKGLVWGGTGSFVLFATALLALLACRRGALSPNRPLFALIGRLPQRFMPAAQRAAAAFDEGIVWPGDAWRGVGVVLASVAIKLLVATHVLWAGLAIGVVLIVEMANILSIAGVGAVSLWAQGVALRDLRAKGTRR